MNGFKKGGKFGEELRERYLNTGLFVLLFFQLSTVVVTTCLLHCCMGPGAVRRVQTAKC